VYGATLLICSGIWGWAADRTESRRLPFLTGLVLLVAATAMLCAGSNIAVILAGRALQGASSAVVWVTGLVVVCDTVGQRHVGGESTAHLGEYEAKEGN
jgi:MFS family permease